MTVKPKITKQGPLDIMRCCSSDSKVIQSGYISNSETSTVAVMSDVLLEFTRRHRPEPMESSDEGPPLTITKNMTLAATRFNLGIDISQTHPPDTKKKTEKVLDHFTDDLPHLAECSASMKELQNKDDSHREYTPGRFHPSSKDRHPWSEEFQQNIGPTCQLWWSVSADAVGKDGKCLHSPLTEIQQAIECTGSSSSHAVIGEDLGNETSVVDTLDPNGRTADWHALADGFEISDEESKQV